MKHWLTKIVTSGNYLAVAGFWFSVWFYRALLVSLTGGIVGLILAPVLRLLFFSSTSWTQAFATGFMTGCQYAGIWATGISLVWVIMDRSQIKSDGVSLLSPISAKKGSVEA